RNAHCSAAEFAGTSIRVTIDFIDAEAHATCEGVLRRILRPFFFATDSRLQQTECAASFATERFLGRAPTVRTRRNSRLSRLHLCGLIAELIPARSRQRLLDLALNFLFAVVRHTSPQDNSFDNVAGQADVGNKAGDANTLQPLRFRSSLI